MAFLTDVGNLDEIVNVIADKLLASHASWTEFETGNYWDGTESDPGYGNGARRALKMERDGDTLYFAFQVTYHFRYMDASSYGTCGSNCRYCNGFTVKVSDAWTDHAPDGNIQNQMVSTCYWGNEVNWSTYMKPKQHQYWMWTDEGAEAEAGNGLSIVIQPEAGHYTYLTTAFLNIERCAPGDKQYADGYSNWWLFAIQNHRPNHGSCGSGYQYADFYSGETAHAIVMHPFSDATPSYPKGIDRSPTEWFCGYQYIAGCGRDRQYWFKGLDLMYGLYRSKGLGKCYFQFPMFHANVRYNESPQFQSKHFICMCSTDSDLVDGDVIALSGETTKYLVMLKGSPWTSNPINVAIKYVE